MLHRHSGCCNSSDISLCWNKIELFQTEHSTSIFPSDFQNSWESRYLGKETHKICAISDHKLKLPQIPIVGAVAMWLKKVAVTCGDCNYCTATSSQWALSDSHCPLLCTSHPGKTNIRERNLEGIGVCCLSGSKFKSSDQSTFVWPM